MVNLTFIWPQEPFLPTSLFKHYSYLGETAGYFKKKAKVVIRDLSVEKTSKRSLIRLLADSDFVFIPSEAYTARSAARLAELSKQSGDAATVAYGTAPAFNPFVFLGHFDYVLGTGHWEKAIEKLVFDFGEFKQILNEGVYSKQEPLNGDSWAHPPLEDLPIDEYFNISPNQLEICVQKGCLANCSFCSEKALFPARPILHRSVDNIMEYVNANNDKSFYIDATTFTKDRDWALSVSEGLKDASVNWKTVTRIDCLDEELVAKMAEGGCTKVGFGVETLSKTVQKSIRKVILEETIKKGVSLLKKYGITPRAFLILGLPNQTADNVFYTEEFISGLHIESRWKEFVPLWDIRDFTCIDDFAVFERNTHRFYEIPGLSKEDYLKLISTKR